MWPSIRAVPRTLLLAWFHPLLVNRTVRATGRSGPVRAAWGVLGALCGLAASFACGGVDQWPLLLLLPVVGVLAALVLSIDLSAGGTTDSVGVLMLVFYPFLFLCPYRIARAEPPAEPSGMPFGWILFLLLFVAILALGGLLAFAAMNRSWMFWPLAISVAAWMYAAEVEPWPVSLVSSFGGPIDFAGFSCGLLLTLFLLFLPQLGYTCVETYRTINNIDDGCYRQVARGRLAFAAFHVVFGGAALLGWYLSEDRPHLLPFALVFLASALLNLSPISWVVLNLWVAAARATGRGFADVDNNLLFRLPAVPLPVIGVGGILARMGRTQGENAAKLAVELLCRTAYQRGAVAYVESLAATDPVLFHRTRSGLAQRGPRPGQPAARPGGSRLGMPPLPALLPRGGPAADDDILFGHPYEPPRGKEGAPLAAVGVNFPIAEDLVETMTLPQIVYRTLASVREPFRRTGLVFLDAASGRAAFAGLLRGLAVQARNHFGAGLLPIPLSLNKLAGHREEITRHADALAAARSRAELSGGASPDDLTLRACVRLLEIGANVPLQPGMAGELTDTLRWGNAWLLIEDDSAGEIDAAAARRLFDLVFGEAGLSHVAILQTTGYEKHLCLSDIRKYTQSPPPAPPPARTPFVFPSPRWFAGVRRLAGLDLSTERLAMLAIPVTAVFLMLVLIGSGPAFDQPKNSTSPWAVALIAFVLLYPLVPMCAGLLAGGPLTEGVRGKMMFALVISGMIIFSTFLLCVPGSMQPGWGRVAATAGMGLPFSFLAGLGLVGSFATACEALWQRRSNLLLRSLGPADWEALRSRHAIELHLGQRGSVMRLAGAGPELPLLVSSEAAGVLADLLEVNPSLSLDVRRLAVECLRRDKSGGCRYPVSSLLIKALRDHPTPAARRCLRGLAEDLRKNWGWPESFGDYQQPGTTLKVNALEYAARLLCHLCDIEEIICVR